MTPRERTEQWELQFLSEHAAHAAESKGRGRAEESCEIRTDFCRDRDRIIHCKAFRRLKQKTQVFLSPQGDHYRTRLTHTLEVSQIARTIARALCLNEDLTEAIALGHDLGHTPFGHAGEHALSECSSFGFKHYEQSVRVVEKLEKEYHGLNLTHETVDGIGNHTKGQWPETLEGCIVRHADRIAYLNHDIEDAISAGVLREGDLPAQVKDVLGNTKSKRITTLIRALIDGFDGALQLDSTTQTAYDALYDFMFEHIYLNKEGAAKTEEHKVSDLVTQLFHQYMKYPEKMPAFYCMIAEREGTERAVVDYISGMSDRYAVFCYNEAFIPKSWGYEAD